MQGGSRCFVLRSHWTVEASVEAVADIISDVERLPDWWGDVYLGVEVLVTGDARGLGRTVAFHSKGWLPYALHWTGRVTAADPPYRWTIEASGDLVGHGQWTLTQNGPFVEIAYDWTVRIERRWMRLCAPLLRPVFAANHRWAMARGREGLVRELTSRGYVAALA